MLLAVWMTASKTKKTSAKKKVAPAAELPTLSFATPRAFSNWLADHHASSRGIWLRLAKKGSGTLSIMYAEAIVCSPPPAAALRALPEADQRGDDYPDAGGFRAGPPGHRQPILNRARSCEHTVRRGIQPLRWMNVVDVR